MNGHVDDQGRALLTIYIRRADSDEATEFAAWIDTSFNGELVLPQRFIEDIRLQQSGTVKAILGDGREVAMETYTCVIDWFGEHREMQVVANAGDFPLLGIGLLAGFDLHISYRSGEITIG